jgi:hypothetical protein
VDEAYIEGQICVTNAGDRATENLQIVDELRDGLPPPNDLIVTINIDVSSNPVLDPGETACYSYRIDLPAGTIHAGGTYKNTANITITNHSGHLGEPFGPSPSATTEFPEAPALKNDTITVVDTNGGSWIFNTSGSQIYSRNFTCGADAGAHINTATLRETGQSDSASVTVNCYSLNVTKDASTSFKRTYHWTIDKTGNQTDLALDAGDTATVNYNVLLTQRSPMVNGRLLEISRYRTRLRWLPQSTASLTSCLGTLRQPSTAVWPSPTRSVLVERCSEFAACLRLSQDEHTTATSRILPVAPRAFLNRQALISWCFMNKIDETSR